MIPDAASISAKRSPRGFDPADEDEYEAQEKKDIFNKLRLSIATHESSHTISPGPIKKEHKRSISDKNRRRSKFTKDFPAIPENTKIL